MKKLLVVLLALAMCFSVFMASCSKKEEKGNDTSKEDKATIAAAINELNLKDLVNSIVNTAFGDESQIQINDLMAELASINGEAVIAFNGDYYDTSIYAGIKDGIIKVGAEGQNAYMFFNNSQLIAVAPSEYGYEISSSADATEDIPAYIGGADLSQYEEMIDMYLTDEVLAALESFELDIKANQINEKDGFYFLTEEVFINIGNEVLDTVVEVMKALDAPESELPTEDELAESKVEMEEAIKAMNLELGFSVKNKKVNGIKFATEFEPDKLDGIGASKEDVADLPSAYTTAKEEISEEISEEKVTFSFTAMLDDNAQLPKSIDMSMTLEEDGDKMEYAYKITYSYNEDGMPVGAELNLEISMGNTYLGEYDFDDKSEYVTIKGTPKYSGTVKLDFSKLSEVGATVVDVNFSMSAKANEYIKEYYSEAANDWIEEVITDSNKIKEIEQANCYLKSGSVTANAKVEKTGVLGFSFSMKENSEETASASGSFSWTAAPNYGTIPEDVRTDFVENNNIAATLERLTEEAGARSADIFMSNPNDYNKYTWYDAESGLWVCFDRWETVEFFTVQPNATVIY